MEIYHKVTMQLGDMNAIEYTEKVEEINNYIKQFSPTAPCFFEFLPNMQMHFQMLEWMGSR